MTRHLLLLLCVLIPGFAIPGMVRGAAAEEDVVAAAQARYLTDRDADALLEALSPHAAELIPGTLPLMRLAAGHESDAGLSVTGPGATPVAALVVALRELDLPAARRIAVELDRSGAAVLANWAGALVRMRAGDDAGALGRLMAPPLFDWDKHAFPLALFGAALPDMDRLMLAATASRALLRAAERRRAPALASLCLALVALDPRDAAPQAALGLRALRRLGASRARREALKRIADAGVPWEVGPVALERAFGFYAAGHPGDAGAIASGMGVMDGAAPVLEGLAKGGVPPVGLTPWGVAHVTGDRVPVELLAHFATLCGRPTETGDVLAVARVYLGRITDEAFCTHFLERSGLAVERFAGDDRALRAMLATGRPVLMWRPVFEDGEVQDAPALIRGFDPGAELFVLDEPDLRRLGLMPSDAIHKARLLCAVPSVEDDALAVLRTSAPARAGDRIGRAIERADTGDAVGAFEALTGGAPNPPVVTLYAGLMGARAAAAFAGTDQGDALRDGAATQLAVSATSAPVLAVEAELLGRHVISDLDTVLARAAEARRAGGASVSLALLEFGALHLAGKSEQGLAALDEAVRLDPLSPHTMFLRGSVHGDRGENALAREDMRRALDRDPTSLDMTVALAKLWMDAGDPAEALRVLAGLERYAPEKAGDPAARLARRAAESAALREATSVDELMAFRRSTEPATRRHLANELAQRRTPEAEDLLRTLLIDDDPTVRVTALRLYRQPWLQRRAEAEGALTRILAGRLRLDPAANARALAAEVLGGADTQVARRALAGRLVGEESDPDPSVRAAVAAALGRHDTRISHEALVSGLEDPDPAVRRAVVDALYRLTGTNNEFDPEGPAEDRARAVGRWRLWLDG